MENLDTAATVWILVATSIVVLMAFGVEFFYYDLVMRKNVASMIAFTLVSLAVVSVQGLWAIALRSPRAYWAAWSGA